MMKLLIQLLFKRPITLNVGYAKFGKYLVTSIEQHLSKDGEEVTIKLKGL